MTRLRDLVAPGVKKLKGGKYKISSLPGAEAARTRIDKLEGELAALLTSPEVVDRQKEIAALDTALDGYVIETCEAGDAVEVGDYRMTKVVQHTREWNPDKLRRLVSVSVFKNITTIRVDAAKVEEMVRVGKIDRKKIMSAFEEKPKKPYVKTSKITEDAHEAGAREADALAGKLA